MKEKVIKQMVVALFLGVFLAVSGVAHAGNIDPDFDDSRYAYGENVGWLNFDPSQGPGVTVADDKVFGYVWAENIGWVSLSCENASTCGTVDYGVGNDGSGNLSGYGWGENVGWINFNPAGVGVTIDADGNFDGWAWGENIGWIHFNNPAIPYKVKTAWIPAPPPPDGNLDGDGDVDRDDLTILLGYRNQPASECLECDLDGDGMITVLDARKLVLMCTRARCATE